MTEPTLDQRVTVLESDRRGRGVRQLLLFVGIVLVFVTAGIWVQRQNDESVQRERMARQASERAFCGIIILLDDAWKASPPTTDSGRALATAVTNARVVNHCPPRTGVIK